jgi:putative ribosome biogenesis GTPase RsgA
MNLKKILPKDGQLIMCLGGSSGTGKSRVINAFVEFSHRWHSTTYVVVTASSGVVASSSVASPFTAHLASSI